MRGITLLSAGLLLGALQQPPGYSSLHADLNGDGSKEAIYYRVLPVNEVVLDGDRRQYGELSIVIEDGVTGLQDRFFSKPFLEGKIGVLNALRDVPPRVHPLLRSYQELVLLLDDRVEVIGYDGKGSYEHFLVSYERKDRGL